MLQSTSFFIVHNAISAPAEWGQCIQWYDIVRPNAIQQTEV